MAIIEVDDFFFSYPGTEKPALRNINLLIDKHEVICLIGMNGSGKSTLCLSLSGLIPQLYQGQLEGSIRINGMDTRKSEPGQFAGKIGLVLQNPLNQLTRMRYSVFEEVAFGLENLGIPREDMKEKVFEALRTVGLEDHQDRSPYSLSGGQQQKLILACILVMDTPILIMDEPTAMLDPRSSMAIYQIIWDLSRLGKTVIIAEQKLEKIPEYAHRVILLSKGKILLEGSPHKVLTSPLLIQAGLRPIAITEAASLGLKKGLWPSESILPVTLDEATAGFRVGMNNNHKIEK